MLNPALLRDFFIFSIMRKTFTKYSLFGAFLIFSSCNFTKDPAAEKVIISENKIETDFPEIEVSEASVREKMEFLASDELKGRETGTEGIDKAAAYIENFFKQNNIKSYFQTYRDSFQTSGKTGFNIVGVLEGNDPELKDEFIILGAHYDHIGIQEEPVGSDSIANGANDNAAGTVAVMELAKAFSEAGNNKRSILFTLFSAEELGLEGAKHLANKLKSKDVDLYAMVNFEMIGLPMEGKDFQAYLTGYERSNLAEKFNEYSGANILGFLPEAKKYNLFQRSDNYPFFQEFNIPAQTISSFDFTNYEYYHHVSDEADNMNFAFMAKLIEAVFPALYSIANTSEREIKLND